MADENSPRPSSDEELNSLSPLLLSSPILFQNPEETEHEFVPEALDLSVNMEGSSSTSPPITANSSSLNSNSSNATDRDVDIPLADNEVEVTTTRNQAEEAVTGTAVEAIDGFGVLVNKRRPLCQLDSNNNGPRTTQFPSQELPSPCPSYVNFFGWPNTMAPSTIIAKISGLTVDHSPSPPVVPSMISQQRLSRCRVPPALIPISGSNGFRSAFSRVPNSKPFLPQKNFAPTLVTPSCSSSMTTTGLSRNVGPSLALTTSCRPICISMVDQQISLPPEPLQLSGSSRVSEAVSQAQRPETGSGDSKYCNTFISTAELEILQADFDAVNEEKNRIQQLNDLTTAENFHLHSVLATIRERIANMEEEIHYLQAEVETWRLRSMEFDSQIQSSLQNTDVQLEGGTDMDTEVIEVINRQEEGGTGE